MMNSFSALFVLLPTFFCSYYVVRAYLKWGTYLTAAVTLFYTAIAITLAEWLRNTTTVADNRTLIPFLVVFFVVYYISVDLPFGRSLVIYLWAMVFMSFPSNAAYIIDAMTHDDHIQMDFGPDIIMIQGIITFVICGGIYIITNLWDARILSPLHTPDSIWYSWMSIPVLFLAMNIAMIPGDYYGIRRFNMYRLYGLFTVCLLLLYIYLTVIFYSFMVEYIHVRDFKEAERIHDMQDLQFRNLQEQMARDSRIRHDFKHTLHVMGRLAASEDWEGLTNYLQEYTAEAMDTLVVNYCTNPALNAVLNYYASKSIDAGIDTELQIDLADELAIGDIEFSSLLGNILENSINGCMTLPEEDRRLSLSVQLKNYINLYIVSTNTFDGNAIVENGNYASTKPGHKGIGLRSIRETVDKYNGTMRIETDDHEFRLDIILKME